MTSSSAATTRATEINDRQPPCPECGRVRGDPSYAELKVCDACGHHDRRSARETIDHLVDPGSFHETDGRLVSRDPLGFVDDVPYEQRLDDLRRRTGESDAIVSGTARIRSRPVVLAVLDFAFLGGSMGVVVGEKIARAAERAKRKRLPLVTVVASGGARMQEGMLSLLQMAKTSAAIKRHKDAGLAYVSVLTNPTTGGVFASFANLGDVIVAEPGALIGFAGPRVAEQAIGRKLPEGSHRAETLLAHGMVDAIVDRRDLPEYLGRILSIVTAPRGRFSLVTDTGNEPPDEAPTQAPDAWAAVQRARQLDRPTSLDYVGRMLDLFVPIRGDRATGDDPAVISGFGLLAGAPVVVVGLERGHDAEGADHHGGRARPEGYRKAQRAMKIAARLKLPVLSLIDTPGAWPGPESEAGGLAAELASSMALMSDLPTPTVAAVIGEGGSGGALALAVADCVLMQAGAIYSVIAPEGAATILFRDAERAPELSERLKITADELLHLELIDEIVPEPGAGARSDPGAAATMLRRVVVRHLNRLSRLPTRRLIEARWNRYQAIGRRHTGEISRWRWPGRAREEASAATPRAAPPARRRWRPFTRSGPRPQPSTASPPTEIATTA